jgi:guanylate kinase
MSDSRRGKLVIFSGPSAGVGKDTILKMFLAKHPDWHQPPSTTTRPARLGEVNGRDMNFIGREGFEAKKAKDEFLEAVLVDNNQWYGTLREPVETLLNNGKNVILRIEVRGALIIKKAIPEAITVFVKPDNWESLEKRIRERGSEDEQAINRRLALAKTELPYQDKYDKIIVNPTGYPERALADLEKALGI